LKSDLLEILLEEGSISPEVARIVRSDCSVSGGRCEDVLRKTISVPEEAVARAISKKLEIPYISLKNLNIDMDVARKFSSVASRWKVLPFKEDEKAISIVFADPSFDSRVQVEKAVIKRYGKKIKPYCASRSETLEKIRQIYEELSHQKVVEHYIKEAVYEEKRATFASLAIPSLLDALIDECVSQKATDMHFVYDGVSFRVFVRKDGSYLHHRSLPPSLAQKFLSALKQRAEMDAGDRIHVQDGHFTHFVNSGRMVNLRVSSIPLVNNGESIVLRVLDDTRIAFDLDRLGFFPEHLEILKKILEKPQGLILVTGPTGSGKTTTLYSIITYLKPFKNSILTIEDPVEYNLPFVRQVQVNRRAGRSPATILRSFLRHDPDVILVGEIRDAETAEVTVQAAETGHLVLSTLHTNDAPSALLRMRDLGIGDISICSSLRLVISQRLVKRICSGCKKEQELNRFEKKYVSEAGFSDSSPYFRGEGCDLCRKTGYRGVDMVYEMLPIDEYDYERIKTARTTAEILEFAEHKGYQPMRQNGLRKAAVGITTVAEVIRSCG